MRKGFLPAHNSIRPVRGEVPHRRCASGPLSGIASPSAHLYKSMASTSNKMREATAHRRCASGGSALKGSTCAKASCLLTIGCAKRLPTAGARKKGWRNYLLERRSSTINKKIRRSCASSACFNNLIISSMYFPPFSSFFIIEQTFDLCILILAFFRYNLEIFSIVPFTLVLKKKKQRTFVLCFFIERFYSLCFLAAPCGPLSGIVSPPAEVLLREAPAQRLPACSR